MNSIQRSLTLLSLAVLLFVGVARAQTRNRIMQVQIPFEFEVGHHILPAGTYFITRFETHILILSDSRDRVVATVVTTPAQVLEPVREAKLQFYVEGGRNVLVRVWTGNTRYGYELSVPKPGLAFAKSRPTEVTAAAGR